jgi:4-hydroxybenzoate-CoA ligase
LHTVNENAALYFVDRHIDEGRGRKTAFITPTGRLTYAEFASQTQHFAAGLTRAGLRPGDRMVMLLPDSLEFCIAFWGAIRAGIIPIPLNSFLPPAALASILADCTPDLLVIADTLPLPPGAPPKILLTGPDWHHFLTEAAAPPIQAAGTDIAFWLYSSGSTSAPKGVRHRHASLRATAATYGTHVLAMREDDIVVSAAKMFFAYGLGNSLTFPLSVGATSILWPDRPAAHLIVDLIAQHRPTLFFGVPTFYAALLQCHALPKPAFASLRLCISAGEALPAALALAWQAATGCPILDGIGSTEMLHIFLSNTPQCFCPGASGIAVPGYQLRILNEQGGPARVDEPGELLVCGPSSATDYWRQPQKSAATFHAGWTRTGDIYVRDAAGFYHYQGRKDDIFKVSGLWVSPFEVESALAAHPAVLEAAIVAHPDDDGLIKPRAFVVLINPEVASPALARELQAHVKASIGAWKYPRWIEFTDALPKTATGKIQRFLLRRIG